VRLPLARRQFRRILAGGALGGPSSTIMTGYTLGEHYADPDLGLKRVHPEDRHLLERSMRSPEEPLVLRWYHKDGGLIGADHSRTHGGRIEAESQPGVGTRMSFILPLLQEESNVS
jgi:hypothetical protein